MTAPELQASNHTAGTTAAQRGMRRCAACGAVCSGDEAQHEWTCPRCGDAVPARKLQSITHCWAFLLAAMSLYVPANVLPVTKTSSFLGSQTDTILSGIIYLWLEGSWGLSVVVFVASILVPTAKLIILSYLLISVHRRSRRAPLARLKLYRVLEVVGRWSMLDIYVIALLSALVQIQPLADITPGPGAIAFGAVVVLTMMATHRFDPRLIWDAADRGHADAHTPTQTQAHAPVLPPSPGRHTAEPTP